jgi:flavin reductase (DIM6/NTAB) family NADH-FMN oxidoreductase RutF
LSIQYTAGSILNSCIALVLVDAPPQRNAMTVSFFSEVAHHPTALWVSIAKHTHTHELILNARRFSLAVLNDTQAEIARKCGSTSGRDIDKCAVLDLIKTESGFLILRGALATTGCEITQTHEVDDHTLFIANILESYLDSRQAHRRQLLLSDL